MHLVEELAQELAYIEALRDRLLRRVKVMAEKLNRIAQKYRGDGSHLETLTQVRRLRAALKQISHRFDELDAQTGEVMPALRNTDSQRTFIRSNRDWLYRTQRAWQPLLLEWDVAGIGFDEGICAAQPHLPVPGAALHAGDRMGVRDPAGEAKQDNDAADGVVSHAHAPACSPRGRTARGRCSRRYRARCRER